MTYDDIREHVISNGFFIHRNMSIDGAAYGTDDISEGILYASKDDPEFVRETSNAARRFYDEDWGTMLGFGERNLKGREYGEYPSKYGNIYIHRERGRTVMFFMFER